jgi:hypothetical protein
MEGTKSQLMGLKAVALVDNFIFGFGLLMFRWFDALGRFAIIKVAGVAECRYTRGNWIHAVGQSNPESPLWIQLPPPAAINPYSH